MLPWVVDWKLWHVRWFRRMSLGGRCWSISSRSSGMWKTRMDAEVYSMIKYGFE